MIILALVVIFLLIIASWRGRVLIVVGALVGGALVRDAYGLIAGAFFGGLFTLYKKQPESDFHRRQREMRELTEEMKLWEVLSPERRADLQARIKKLSEEDKKQPAAT